MQNQDITLNKHKFLPSLMQVSVSFVITKPGSSDGWPRISFCVQDGFVLFIVPSNITMNQHVVLLSWYFILFDM